MRNFSRYRPWEGTVIVPAKVRDLYIVVRYLELDSVAMNQMNLKQDIDFDIGTAAVELFGIETSGLRVSAERDIDVEQVEEPAGQGKGTANEHKVEEIGSRKLVSVTSVISGCR